jgi:hypothetical protein
VVVRAEYGYARPEIRARLIRFWQEWYAVHGAELPSDIATAMGVLLAAKGTEAEPKPENFAPEAPVLGPALRRAQRMTEQRQLSGQQHDGLTHGDASSIARGSRAGGAVASTTAPCPLNPIDTHAGRSGLPAGHHSGRTARPLSAPAQPPRRVVCKPQRKRAS